MTASKRHSKSSKALSIGFDGTPLFRKTDGIGRYTYNLIDAYATQYPDVSITIVAFLDDPIESCDLFAKHTNIQHFKLPFPRKLYQGLYSRVVRIPVDLLCPRFDVYIGTNFVRYPYIKNVPTLTVIHDMAYTRFPEVIELRNLRYLTKHVPRTVNEDTVIVPSDFTKREVEEILRPRKSIRIVKNGVSSAFHADKVTHRKNYILTVGTIEPRKNLKTLLNAYSELPIETRQKHPLLVVGNGGWGDQEHEELPYVSYTGYVNDEDLITLYREAQLFVFPSIYEGFGLPVLEALSTGTPTLCSDIPPLREITHDQATFFDPHDTEALAKHINEALKNPPRTPEKPTGLSWTDSARSLHDAIGTVCPLD